MGKEFTTINNGYSDSKKCDTDIGPLIKEETMTGTEWNRIEEKIQDFIWALGPKATHQITRPEYRTEPN